MNAAAYSRGRVRLAFLLGGTAAIAPLAGKPADAITINDAQATTITIDNTQIPAAPPDSTNQFPNVVSLFDPASGSFCTGTLINSRTILTAADCLTGETPATTRISFALMAGQTNLIGTSSFIEHPGFVPAPKEEPPNPSNDIALISLATPVTSIAPVTLINPSGIAVGALTTSTTPIPTAGTTLAIVGYGYTGNGSTGCITKPDSIGTRRLATTELGTFAPPQGAIIAGTTITQLFSAQFRNPANPNVPNNYFGLTASITLLSDGTCTGDSGGPAFIRNAQGLVQIGELFGEIEGRPAPRLFSAGVGEYGEISDWTLINLFLTWITQNDPLRKVSAVAGNFNWSNRAACRRSSAQCRTTRSSASSMVPGITT